MALKVADVGRSLEFYRDKLGFAEMMRLNRDDGTLWLVYLGSQIRSSSNCFRRERAAGRRRRMSTAINHFCLECDDLEATAAARLREAGIRLTVEPKMGLDRQSPMLDRGSRRQSHRVHADVAGEHAGGSDQAIAWRLKAALCVQTAPLTDRPDLQRTAIDHVEGDVEDDQQGRHRRSSGGGAAGAR